MSGDRDNIRSGDGAHPAWRDKWRVLLQCLPERVTGTGVLIDSVGAGGITDEYIARCITDEIEADIGIGELSNSKSSAKLVQVQLAGSLAFRQIYIFFDSSAYIRLDFKRYCFRESQVSSLSALL